MPADKDYYRGSVKVNFQANDNLDNLFLDFHGREISRFHINGKLIAGETIEFKDHRILFKNQEALRQNEENVVSFEFENTFVDNSAGLHKYVDVTDQRTYVYSHCEPFFCHRWFPCFDQPSLRATLDLQVLVPGEDWKVVSNGNCKEVVKIYNHPLKNGDDGDDLEYW